MEDFDKRVNLVSQNLKQKLFDGMAAQFLVKLKSLIFFPLLASFMSTTDLGSVSYILNTTALILPIALLNLPDTSARFILRKQLEIGVIYKISSVLIILTSIFASVYGILFGYIHFIYAGLYLFCKGLEKVLKLEFQIFQDSKVLLVSSIITEYTSLVLLLAFYLLGVNVTFEIILKILIFSTLLAMSYLYVKGSVRLSSSVKVIFSDLIPVIKSAFYLLPASYGMVLINSSDILLVENYLGLDAVGHYGFSVSIGGILSGLTIAIGYFWNSTAIVIDKSKTKSLMNDIIFYTLLGASVFTMFYGLFLERIISIINATYIQDVRIIKVMLASSVFAILSYVFQGLMYAGGYERRILIDITLAALLNIIVNLVFLDQGILIAAISTFASFLLLFVLRLRFTVRRFSFRLSPRSLAILLIYIGITIIWI